MGRGRRHRVPLAHGAEVGRLPGGVGAGPDDVAVRPDERRRDDQAGGAGHAETAQRGTVAWSNGQHAGEDREADEQREPRAPREGEQQRGGTQREHDDGPRPAPVRIEGDGAAEEEQRQREEPTQDVRVVGEAVGAEVAGAVEDGDDGDPEDGRQHVLAETRDPSDRWPTTWPMPDDRLDRDHQRHRNGQAGEAIDLVGDVQPEYDEHDQAGGVVGGEGTSTAKGTPSHATTVRRRRAGEEARPDPDRRLCSARLQRPQREREDDGDVADEQQEVGEVAVDGDVAGGDQCDAGAQGAGDDERDEGEPCRAAGRRPRRRRRRLPRITGAVQRRFTSPCR